MHESGGLHSKCRESTRAYRSWISVHRKGEASEPHKCVLVHTECVHTRVILRRVGVQQSEDAEQCAWRGLGVGSHGVH
eukprot:2402211-Rhodomonas_salina.2